MSRWGLSERLYSWNMILMYFSSSGVWIIHTALATWDLLLWNQVTCLVLRYGLCVKVKLHGDVTGHHILKECGGSGDISPHFFNFNTRWKWVVSFEPRPLCPAAKFPRSALGKTFFCRSEQVWTVAKRETSCLYRKSKPDSSVIEPVAFSLYWLSCPVHSETFNCQIKSLKEKDRDKDAPRLWWRFTTWRYAGVKRDRWCGSEVRKMHCLIKCKFFMSWRFQWRLWCSALRYRVVWERNIDILK